MRDQIQARLREGHGDGPRSEGAVWRRFFSLTPRAARLLLVLPVLALASVACTPQQVMEMKLVGDLNKMRTEKGLQPLSPDPGLSAVARARAEDMARKSYFSHQPPDGCDFRCLLNKQGVPMAWAGEIISWNNAPLDRAVPMSIGMWRNSPAHYGIITNCQFTGMGTGAAIAPDGRVYHVALFEGNSPDCASQ
jgi:uncharacterized protein YkwD